MAQEFFGVMAGIGDAETDKNVILPELDAEVISFIMNGNAIINGLEYSRSTGELTAGTIVCKGYRGILPNTISGITDKYVYARFTVFHDKSQQDEFAITTSPTPINIRMDLLAGPGEYYFELYPNRESSISYPVRAEHSDISTNLESGGTIDGNVTAVTQPIGNKSSYVATTAFVANEIQDQINSGRVEVLVAGNNSRTIAKVTFVRKAYWVTATFDFTVNETPTLGERYTFSVPEGYKPKYPVDVILPTPNGEAGIVTQYKISYFRYQLKTDGSFSTYDSAAQLEEIGYTLFTSTDTTPEALFDRTYTIGYEINKE